jgi:hypothetical protein
VAIGRGVGGRASVGDDTAGLAELGIEARVGSGRAAVWLGETEPLIGPQAANPMTSSIRLGKKRILLINLLGNMVYISLF